jgi:tellurite methyltransferase
MSRAEAQGWDEIWSRWSGVWEGRPPEQAVTELAARLKAEGRRRVHDLGCGPGRHLLFLAAEGFEMTELPAEDGSLDAVIAWDVVYHGTLETIQRTVGGARRKLSPGGYLLLTFNSVESANWRRAREEVARGEAEEMEPNTFVVPGDSFDKTLPHHYTTEPEIRERIMDGFRILSLTDARGAARTDRRGPSVKFHVLAARDDSQRMGNGPTDGASRGIR